MKAVIHYAAKNQAPDRKWREQPGVIITRGRGPGPRNVLLQTEKGTVVVPRGNVRLVQ